MLLDKHLDRCPCRDPPTKQGSQQTNGAEVGGFLPQKAPLLAGHHHRRAHARESPHVVVDHADKPTALRSLYLRMPFISIPHRVHRGVKTKDLRKIRARQYASSYLRHRAPYAPGDVPLATHPLTTALRSLHLRMPFISIPNRVNRRVKIKDLKSRNRSERAGPAQNETAAAARGQRPGRRPSPNSPHRKTNYTHKRVC
jgi:hypothetical protein